MALRAFAGNPLQRSSLLHGDGPDFMKQCLSSEASKVVRTVGGSLRKKVLCRTAQAASADSESFTGSVSLRLRLSLRVQLQVEVQVGGFKFVSP